MGLIKALTSLDELVWNACSKVTDAAYKVGLDKYDLSHVTNTVGYGFSLNEVFWWTLDKVEKGSYRSATIGSIIIGIGIVTYVGVKDAIIDRRRREMDRLLHSNALLNVTFDHWRPLFLLSGLSAPALEPKLDFEYGFQKTLLYMAGIGITSITLRDYFLDQYPRPPSAKKNPFKEYFSRLREYVAKPVREM